MVDLPLPLAPTSAQLLPAGMLKLSPCAPSTRSQLLFTWILQITIITTLTVLTRVVRSFGYSITNF